MAFLNNFFYLSVRPLRQIFGLFAESSMDSDSENSENEVSRFSMNSMQINGSTDRSSPEHSNNNLDDTADESMIVTKKKNRFKRILDSDSEESDSKQTANNSDEDEDEISVNERKNSESESEEEIEARKDHSTDEDENTVNENEAQVSDHSTDIERDADISKNSSANQSKINGGNSLIDLSKLSFVNENSSKNGSFSDKSNGNTSGANRTAKDRQKNHTINELDDSLSSVEDHSSVSRVPFVDETMFH